LELQTLQAIAAISQILLALTALVVSAVITWIVNKRSKRIAELQYWRAVGNVWMDIDKFALSSDQNLSMVDHLFHPDLAHQSIEDRRKRWFGYMVLNVFSDAYHGVDKSLDIGPESDHRDNVRQELKPLMQDDVLYDLSQSGIYGTEFEKVCAQVRAETRKSATSQQGET
jgi:hypothetical protein